MKKFLKCFAGLFLFMVLISSTADAQLYRSIASGNWNANSTWEVSTNGGATWMSASSTPTSANSSQTTINHTVTVTANVSVSELNLMGTISINSGIVLTYPITTLTLNSGTSVTGAGTFQFSIGGNLYPLNGSNFSAILRVNSGILDVRNYQSYTATLNGNVIIDAGAGLWTGESVIYTLIIKGSLTVNGTITGWGHLKFYGSSLSNSGNIEPYIFTFDSTTSASGIGTLKSSQIYINPNGNVTLTSNGVFAPNGGESLFEIKTGGIFSPNSNIFTFSSGRFAILTGGTVVNSGTVRTQNTVTVDPRTGSNFNADLNVFSGTTIVTSNGNPNTCRVNGNVVINSGATFYSGNSSVYTVSIYGNLTNNGTMTGAGSSVRFFGAVLVNTGSIASPYFTFDSTCTVSGNGTYTGLEIHISSNGNATLLNDVTFSPAGTGSLFEIKTGGIFTANGFIFTFSSGRFAILSGGTVVNSGTVRTQNTVQIDPRAGSNFNANLNVFSGTASVAATTNPYTCRVNGNVVINAGATFYSGNSVVYVVSIYGNLTNNGTMTGAGSTVVFFGAVFINNGSVATPEFKFDSTSTLSGTGSWSTTANIISGSVVTLTSGHQFHSTNINTGAVFLMGSNTAKFTASNPIIQNGTLSNTGSTIEYNGSDVQNISAANITYYGLRINNPTGTVLLANVPVNDTLSVIIGDLDLNGNVITVSPTGYLTETPGNTVKGNSGYIITTRNLNAPSSLNVAGFGSILTTASNLGSTEIKRGHTPQNGLSGNTSILRYFDITPSTNTGLNATLVFKYDESELNGKVEPALTLFRSTNTGSSWVARGGTVNTVANNITLSGIDAYSRWSASSTSAVVSTIKLIMEGFYNVPTTRLNMRDTARVYLRNSSSPYAIVDSAKSIIDSVTYTGSFLFSNAGTGTYYLQTKHRNSIETWSKTPQSYTLGTGLNYDFTDNITKAFGNNMVQKSSKFCLYSGDVNQDGIIDIDDNQFIDNDAFNFGSGYVVSDVTGDDLVDLADASIADNNALNFVGKITP